MSVVEDGRIHVEALDYSPAMPVVDHRSAGDMVQSALRPQANVDFPLITELCERLEAKPSECPAVVQALTLALCDTDVPYRTKLKALTIINELLYSDRAVSLLRASQGLPTALTTLRGARGTGLGDATDANIRMLASEIEKVCFLQQTPTEDTILSRASKGLAKAQKSLELRLEKADVEGTLNKVDQALEAAGARMEKTATTASSMFNGFAKKVSKAVAGDTPVGSGGASATSSRHSRRGPADVVPTVEDAELQWALQASLAGGSFEPPSRTTAARVPDDVARLQAAEARAERAEAELQAFELGGPAAALLRGQIEESDALSSKLASSVREAEDEVKRLDTELQWLTMQSQATERAAGAFLEIVAGAGERESQDQVVDRLLAHISQLEAEVERARHTQREDAVLPAGAAASRDGPEAR